MTSSTSQQIEIISPVTVETLFSSPACDVIRQPMDLPEEHSTLLSSLIEEIKKYKKGQPYFLENPKSMYDPSIYPDRLSAVVDTSRKRLLKEGLSIGVAQPFLAEDASPNYVSLMFISRSRHLALKECIQATYSQIYDSKEASNISFFCRRFLSLKLPELKILVIHRILIDDSLLHGIARSDFELLHLISCWWDLRGPDASGIPRKNPSFKRLHLTYYESAFMADGRLLHSELEELIVNSYVPPRKGQLWLDLRDCHKLKHM
jgi:hypothetical protein